MSDKQTPGRLDKSTPIFIAGHRGMAGAAIQRQLQALGYTALVTAPRAELDLTEQSAVRQFFQQGHIGAVVLAAAKVGGIHANSSYAADFLLENLLMEANVIQASHAAGVQRLLFLGSSCIYPRLAAQPMREEALLTGALEPTNEPYAIAKIAGIKLCESFNRQHGRDYRSVMPTNLYGPGDNYHAENSHVIPALLRRFHEAVTSGATEVEIWGSGKPMREFLHVDDMAAAAVHVFELPTEVYRAHTETMCSHINVGTGLECSIRELAETIAKVTGFQGRLLWDSSKPDGAPRKLLDVSRLAALGWRAGIALEPGLRDAYDWYRTHLDVARR